MLILLIVALILLFGGGSGTTTGEAPVGAVHITVAACSVWCWSFCWSCG
jgi:hypothetical protein